MTELEKATGEWHLGARYLHKGQEVVVVSGITTSSCTNCVYARASAIKADIPETFCTMPRAMSCTMPTSVAFWPLAKAAALRLKGVT